MSAPSLLIEIGCEELPARFMQPLAQALHDGITQGLDKAGVSRGSSQSYATPRRVAVLIQEVATEQPEQAVERLGPALSAALRDGAPSPAGLGFAKSCGVDFAELEQVQTPKGEYLMFRSRSPGQATATLLQAIFADTIKQMDKLVPKRMRWGAGEEAFVRPVHWICALHGSQALALQGWGLSSAQHSFGHRFHAPDAIELPQADTYVEALRQAKVWADVDSRRAEIARQVEAAGQARGGQARMDADLLDEVTALVEWPVAISGGFEERFLDVPAEAIVLTIQDNQRYFPVFDPEQRLLPCFVTVANIDSADATQVVAGNERVVRPRLEDALFFWQQDLKTPLAQRLDDLARVTWAQGLGSLKDKALRLQTLCAALAPEFGLNADAAGQAGLLAKCDLTTKMVFEMPELQGIMGGHYLRAEDTQAGDIADAVAEQYRPAGPSESIPSTAMGQLLSLADKLDTLCGYFSIGAIPTGSKDPFGLRRAALGLLRILLEGGHKLPMQALLDQVGFALDAAQREKLVDFLHDRLRGLLTDKGLPAQVVAAVLPTASGPLDAQHRAQAVADFMRGPAGEALASSSKRVRNILRAATDAPAAQISPSAFEADVEAALHQALQGLPADANQSDYPAALQGLATLQAPIDAFFEGVMVNADDPQVRANRLALLSAFDAACSAIADFETLASGG